MSKAILDEKLQLVAEHVRYCPDLKTLVWKTGPKAGLRVAKKGKRQFRCLSSWVSLHKVAWYIQTARLPKSALRSLGNRDDLSLQNTIEDLGEVLKAQLTTKVINREIDYCPDSGVFTRASPSGRSAVGKAVGYIDPKGYLKVSLGGRQYYAHQLALFLHLGVWPSSGMHTDHIDGDRLNNRLTNLRLCTAQENAQNRKAQANSKSGYKGVSFRAKSNKWHARIVHKGKAVLLGDFTCKEEAYAAYCAAAARHHTHNPCAKPST
jgi:hypothetical protein